MPELGLALTEVGELALAERVLSKTIAARGSAGEIVTLAAQIERAALRLRSDPRGGWEDDLELVESALPSLEAAVDSDRAAHRALGRGWFLVGLVRGLWAGRLARGEEALELALAHARAAGDRRQEAEIVARLGFAAWSGPMPVPEAIERCNDLLVGAGDDTFITAGGRRWLASLVARRGRFDEARALLDEAVTAYEELGRSLNTTIASAFGYGDVEWLAGDLAAAERALRRGFEELEHLGELGYRASVAALESRVLHRLGRLEEAERFAAIVEATASEDDIWSQVLFRLTRARVLADSNRFADAETVGREALATVERTDLLDLHGDTLLDLGHVLRAAGRDEEAKACAERRSRSTSERRTWSPPSGRAASWALRSPGRDSEPAGHVGIDGARRERRDVERRGRRLVERGQGVQSDALDDRVGNRVERGAVEDGLMVGGVELQQAFAEHTQATRLGIEIPGELPDRVDLPEHDRCGWIEKVPSEQQRGSLVALPAVLSRVDPEVGDQAALGGNRRQLRAG